jgi:hypothetical protein
LTLRIQRRCRNSQNRNDQHRSHEQALLRRVSFSRRWQVMASFIVNFSMSHFVVFRVRRSLPATT